MLLLNSNMSSRRKEYRNLLKQSDYVLFDRNNLMLRLLYDNELRETLYKECLGTIKRKTGGNITTIDRASCIEYLVDYAKIPAAKLKKYNSKQSKMVFTLERDNLELLRSYGYRDEFMWKYIEYLRNKSTVEKIEPVINRMEPTSLKCAKSGSIAYLAKYKLDYAITGRAYTNDINIQQFNKTYLDGMCVQEGRIMIRGDLGQADLRVACSTIITSKKLKELMLEYTDAYEAFARYMYIILGAEFDYELFMTNRSKYKVAVLSRMYGEAKEILIKKTGDLEFVEQLNLFFEKEPSYQRYIQEIERIKEQFEFIKVYDYFGNEMIVDATQDNYVNCAVNYPIQSTTNSIIEHLTCTLKDLIPSFRVEVIRHDEPVFSIAKEDLEKAYELGKIDSIKVNHWQPIPIKWHFSYNYGIDEESTQLDFEQNKISGDIGNYVEVDNKPKFFKKSRTIDIVVIDGITIGYEPIKNEYFVGVDSDEGLDLKSLACFCNKNNIGFVKLNTEEDTLETLYVDGINMVKTNVSSVGRKLCKELYEKIVNEEVDVSEYIV